MLNVLSDLTNIDVSLTQISQQANYHIGNTEVTQFSGITAGIRQLGPSDVKPNFWR